MINIILNSTHGKKFVFTGLEAVFTKINKCNPRKYPKFNLLYKVFFSSNRISIRARVRIRQRFVLGSYK